MDGTKALVTGASRGIGRAVAIELARRGMNVVASMRDPEAADFDDVGAIRGSIEVARLDVTDPSTISVPSDLGVLVNNAGIDASYLPVEHLPVDEWRRVFETNVFGLVAMTQAAIAVMRPRRTGVICNLTSAAVVFPMPLYAIYRSSKAAVAALGETLAAELREFGIRVVEVQPGPIATEMLAESARMPEAATVEAYAGLAKRTHEARLGMAETTEPDVAASAICDAITDDNAPLRVSCDEVGRGLAQGFDATPYNQWFGSLVKTFDP
jgi:NAD(P)-dependent dehydrogenase (short-subunit alcohol dehydrogenase family)